MIYAVAQLKSDFVSTVSHEFRAPLAGIHQLAEMLQDGRGHDDQRRSESYGMIVTETQRLRRLVENVLDFVGAAEIPVCGRRSLRWRLRRRLCSRRVAIRGE